MDAGHELSPAEVEALDWSACWSPAEVAARLDGIATPWYVAGGWAVDLFLGTPTRPHGDIEIGIPAGRFGEVRARLAGYALDAVGSGRVWRDAAPDELAAVHQTWVRDPATGGYLLDVFREPHDGGEWVCRRDPAVRLPYQEVILRTGDGIPYVAPEIALLFKAKAARPKDEVDLEVLLPHVRRGLLAELLSRVHPGHPWLARL